MRRAVTLVLMLAALTFAGLVLGQDNASDPLVFYRQIGANPPVSVKYDPQRDQFALVNPDGELMLVSAADFTVSHSLYKNGTYNAFQFSHDGHWLALAIDKRVELWDTETGTVAVSIEPPGANSVTGPLMFSDDDSFLALTAVVPASQATRRSENDTDLLPWLWDVNAALDIGSSRLPGRVDAYSFFDYRTGNLFLGPNNIILAAIPNRLQLIDSSATSLTSFNDIETARFENDPVSLWFSAYGDLMYALKTDTGTLVQINTRTKQTFEMPLGRQLSGRELQRFDALTPSSGARVIGQSSSREIVPLVRALFGYDYRSDWNYHRLTVTLLDVLVPQTAVAGDRAVLLYIFDEETGSASIEFFSPGDGESLALRPHSTQMALYAADGDRAITVYDLDSGLPTLRFNTAVSDSNKPALFAYNEAGDSLQAGYQRYNADTGTAEYEILDYAPSFDSYYFTDDNSKLVTISGSDWWMWDVETDTVVRRERLNLDGSLRDTWRDGQRFLLDINDDHGQGIEINEIGKDERPRLYFDTPSDMTISQVIPSPSWSSFLVVYSANQTSPQYPNGAVAIYTMGIGRRSYIAGADLPPGVSSYGWIDDQTAYVTGTRSASGTPERVYGIDFDPSGVPACLIERYPEQATAWTQVWERLAYYRSADDVAHLAEAVCQAPDAASVDALYTPEPTNTPAPAATNALTRISGVPDCLTTRYPDQALAFARQWRQLTEGLTPDQVKDMETLLCEGISSAGQYGGGYTGLPNSSGQVGALIYTIDVASGMRTNIPSLPTSADTSPATNLVENQFRRQFGFLPSGAVLSPNHQLLAVQSVGGHVILYQLAKPYDSIIAEATATAVGTAQSIPNAIRVRPTGTPQPDGVGVANPTLTPTFVPTAIPLVEATASLTQLGVTEELCPAVSVARFSERPDDFNPMGILLGSVAGSSALWRLDLAEGALHPDETNTMFSAGRVDISLDQNWVLAQDDENGLYVAHPDGSGKSILLSAAEARSLLDSAYWYDLNHVLLNVNGYLPDRLRDSVLLRQFYDVRDGSFSTPERPKPSISINNLPTQSVSVQPNGGNLQILTTPVNLPDGTGYRYYVYDGTTDTYTYFARSDASETISFEWNPYGTLLYYYPSWTDFPMVFDPVTGEHRVLPEHPTGSWSRDGRTRLDDYYPPQDLIDERKDAHLPIPSMQIWDSQTGMTHLYCLPDEWRDVGDFAWSPDSRYLAVRARQPGDQSENTREYYTIYLLDTTSGQIVDLGADMTNLTVWTEAMP